VVEFVDPAIASRKKKRRLKDSAKDSVKGLRKRDREEERQAKKDRRQLWKSVRALGSVGLKGKEKWQYKMDLIKKVGGKAPKNRKVPYKILVGMRAKERKRTQWRENDMRESGVVVGKSNSFLNLPKKKGKRRSAAADGIMRPAFGHMKGGTLFLKKSDM